MAHKHWEDLIPFYIAQTLPEGQARELAQHLRTCDSCRYVYDEWREISAAVVLAADEWSQDVPPLSAVVREHVAKGRSEEATQRTPKVVRQADTEISTQRSMPSVPTMVTSTPPVPTPPYTNVPVFGAAPPPPKLIILPPPVRKRQSSVLPLVMAAAAIIVFLLIGGLALVGLQALLNNGGRTPDNIAMRPTETPSATLESAILQRTSATPTNTLTPPITPPNNTSAKLPTIEPTLEPSSFETTLATEEFSVTEETMMQSLMMDATPEGGIGGGNFTIGDCPELYFIGSACEVQVEARVQRFEFGLIVKRSDQDMALVIFDNGTIGEPTRVDAVIGAPLDGQFAPDYAFMPYYRTGLGWAIDNPQTYTLAMSHSPEGTILLNLPDERVILITSDLAGWTTLEP